MLLAAAGAVGAEPLAGLNGGRVSGATSGGREAGAHWPALAPASGLLSGAPDKARVFAQWLQSSSASLPLDRQTSVQVGLQRAGSRGRTLSLGVRITF